MKRMKPLPRLCERIVKDGKMWCNTHNRPHTLCNGGPWGKEVNTDKPMLEEQLEGKVMAPGTSRAFTPSERE